MSPEVTLLHVLQLYQNYSLWHDYQVAFTSSHVCHLKHNAMKPKKHWKCGSSFPEVGNQLTSTIPQVVIFLYHRGIYLVEY
jgi:hypothetical protein